MNVRLEYGRLTYKDVRTILALVDGWPVGRIHFETDDMVVDAVTERPGTVATRSVLSPAVGTFKAELRSGIVASGACIGHIEAPHRSTPVFAAEEGQIGTLLARENDFVEYGQPLVLMTQIRSKP